MSTFKVCGAEDFTCAKSIFPNQWSTKDHDIESYMKLPGLSLDIEIAWFFYRINKYQFYYMKYQYKI